MVEEAPAPVIPESPLAGINVITSSDSGVQLAHGDESAAELALTGPVSLRALSPDGQYAAIVVGGNVVLADREAATLQTVFEGTPDMVHTGDWKADGSVFYFGFYKPGEGGRMAAGDIRTLDPATGDVGRVGCSASKAVIASLPDGNLAVRDSDNLYAVVADGCATLRTTDARRMHQITPNASGSHMAFIFRELVYNRDSRQYEPDSTLYLAPTSEGEPVKVIGDRYSPRNPSWSADGSELLYDVAPPDGGGARAVSVYVIADGQSSYLNPPSASSSAEMASFSPSSRHVIYHESGDWMVKTTGSQFAQALPVSLSNVAWSWVDENTLITHPADGESMIVSLAGASPTAETAGANVQFAWPR